MATLNGGASGSTGNYGTARGRLVYKAVANAVLADSGSAQGLVVAGILVTTLGVQMDVGGAVPAQLTQIGAQVDVQRIVPAQLSTIGIDIDVLRLVPAHVTTAGVQLDVDRIVPTQLSTIGAQIDARLQRRRTLTMCWEFHVYNRAGVYLAYLDNAFDKSYLTQLWDVGGGSFKLPTSDPKATVTNLKVGNIVKARYANVDIGAWIMETIATTYVDTGEGAARIITVSGRGLLGSLYRALVYPSDLADPATTQRLFTAAPKGEMLLTLYEEYVARGGGLFTTGFTDTHDSNSVAWTDSLSLEFKAGQTLLDVLRQLQGFGLEVVAQPDKTLDAYTSAGTDKSASVAFRYGQNMLACSVITQGGDLANAVLGEASNLFDEDTDATSISSYGRLEAHLPVRNTSEADDIAAANSVFLTTFKDPPNAIALQVATFPDYPIVDYDIGDMVHVSVPDDIDADYRVLAIAIQEGSGPCDLRVTLELNSIQAEYLGRLQRAMNATLSNIQPGSASSIGMASSSTSEGGTGGATTLDGLTDVTITGTPADNEVLAWNTGTGQWINQTADEAGLTPAVLTTKGDLLTWGTALDRLPVGTAGQVLTVQGTATHGVEWATPVVGGTTTVVNDALWAARGDLLYGTGDDAGTVLAVGSVGQVLTVSSGTIPAWEDASAGGDVATDTIWAAKGDLVYGLANDSGTVLSIGTVGHVLTVGVGTVPAWAAASGGTLGVWMPDAAPSSAHAKNDEFADSSFDTGKWTEWDPASNLTVAENSYGLSLLQTSHGGAECAGVFQAVPASGDWAVWTKASLLSKQAAFCYIGLMLGQDLTNNPSTSDAYTIHFVFDNPGSNGYIQVSTWSSYTTTTGNAASIADVMFGNALYFRIRKASTTYSFDWSSDGIAWSEIYSAGLAFAPAEFGVFLNNQNTGVNMRAVFPFFRCTTDNALTDVMQGKRV